MDAIELLKEDHDRVEKLFEQFKKNEDGKHGPLFKKINNELIVHTHIEEVIFYPALLEKGKKDLKQITREGIEEHGQVKELLSDLSKMRSNNKQFNPKLQVVVEDVEHHVKEEENDMFPLVRKQLSEKALVELGTRLASEKIKKQRELGIKPTAQPRAEKGMVSTMLDKAKDMINGMMTTGADGGKPASSSKPKAKKSAAKKSTAKRSSQRRATS